MQKLANEKTDEEFSVVSERGSQSLCPIGDIFGEFTLESTISIKRSGVKKTKNAKASANQ